MAKRNPNRRPILGRFETLEKREMFAASPFSLSGKTLTVNGTSGNDVFEFTAGPTYRVAINGEVRTYNAADVTKINFNGQDGDDQALIVGGASAETAKLSPTSGTVAGPGYSLRLDDFLKIEVQGDATDQAWLYDAATNDSFVASPTRSELTGATFKNIVKNFGQVRGYGTAGGVDSAAISDSAGNDTLLSTPTYSSLTGTNFLIYAAGFENVVAVASGGNDTANLHDSTGNDTLTARPDASRLVGAGFDNLAQGFDRVNVYARSGGIDKAYLYDSRADDTFLARSTFAYMSGPGYYNYAEQFDEVYGAATYGGNDTAWLYDTAGNDSFVGKPGIAYLTGNNFYMSAREFDQVNAYATGGGNDTAWLSDSPGDDIFNAYSTWARLSGTGFNLLATSFDRVNATAAAGGNDQAFLYDSAGDDSFVGRPTYSYLSGAGFYNFADRFDAVQAIAGSGGIDTAWFYDSAGDDVLLSRPNQTSLTGAGFFNSSVNFARVYAYANTGGYDTATLFGSPGYDTFWARDTQGRMIGAGYNNFYISFDAVRAMVDSTDRVDISGVTNSLLVENDTANSIPLGSGVLSPFKVLADPSRPNTLLAITGSGESSGTAWLHRLDATTLAPLSQPINVGINASDLNVVGQYLVVSSRGSSDVHLIDLAAWRKIDRMATVKEAISIAALPNNRFAVVGIQSDRVQLFGISGGQLSLLRDVVIGGVAYDITASTDGTRLYVNLPNKQQVAALDANTLATLTIYNTGGTPSYGGLVMGDFYLTTDRDGFIRIVNTATGVVTTIDVALLLGLNPANVPLRGIDPKNFVVIGPNRLLLVNDRQNSLVLDIDLTSPTPSVSVVKQVTGAASATFLPESNEALMVQPVTNRIDRIQLQQPGFPSTRVTVGVGLGAAVRMPQEGGLVAVLTSQHKLMLVNEQTQQVREVPYPPGYQFYSASPLQIDAAGNLVTVAYSGNKVWKLIRVNSQGTVLNSYPINIPSVFAMEVKGHQALLIDRLNSQVQTIDLNTGATATVVLQPTRAREGIILDNGSWLVVHDTNPDIGVTLSRNGVTEFVPMPPGIRWFSDVVQIAPDRVLISDFGGRLVVFNTATKTYGVPIALPFDGVTNVYREGNTIYAISPSAGKVAVVDAGTLTVRDVWSVSDVVGLAPSSGGAWVMTSTAVIWKYLA